MTRSDHVLVSCPLILNDIGKYEERLRNHGITYDIADVDQQLTESELLDVIDQYDGIIAGDDELTERVLEEANRLRVISKWGIGIDGIDTEAASDQGIEVFNTPGAFSEEVADVVIGYAVMLTRDLHRIDREVRRGNWICPRGRSLNAMTFGVVGVGHIGSTVARRASEVGANVLGSDIRELPDELVEETGIERVEVQELFERSDVVSLNCALTPETERMVSHGELDALGPEGYLINTSRGRIVDEQALVEALQEGRLAGAALDVFKEEPLPSDHPLAQLDTTILGTHNAQNTVEAVQAVHDRAVDNLIEGLA